MDFLCSGDLAAGVGPRRSAFQAAIRAMLSEGYWEVMGDAMIPCKSPVIEDGYWKPMGGLIALALLIGESLHPVAPAVVYALLSNVLPLSDPRAPMHLSLEALAEFSPSVANNLIPWMIIPSGQDWRTLPAGHRTKVLELAAGLDVNVS